MKVQGIDFGLPDQKVKVKMENKVIFAEVEKCPFVLKLTMDCLYLYVMSKVDV